MIGGGGASCLYAAVWRETISSRVAFVMKNKFFKNCSHGIPEETEQKKKKMDAAALFQLYVSCFTCPVSSATCFSPIILHS